MMRYAAVLALASFASAEGPADAKPVENVPEEKAKAAIESFRREFAGEDLDFKLEAVTRVARVVHPDVATLLLGLAFNDKDVNVRAMAFKGLANQKTSTATIGPRISRWLLDAAEANRKAKARGDYGVVLDKKTGDVDTQSDEGKAALKAKRERGRMIAEAMKLVDGIGYREKDSVEGMVDFLDDGNDDVVALSLGMLGKWKEWSVLRDLLDLFEIYPEEDRFETGSVSVDTGAAGSADAQAAKRKWMSKFGDPDKRRARPKVVKALKQALLDITGEKFEEPKALREYLKRPEVKRKVRAK
jgi:hypothetical protein